MAIKEQVAELTTKLETLGTTLDTEVGELTALFEDLKTRLAAIEGLDIGPQLAAIDGAIGRVAALSDLATPPETPAPTA